MARSPTGGPPRPHDTTMAAALILAALIVGFVLYQFWDDPNRPY